MYAEKEELRFTTPMEIATAIIQVSVDKENSMSETKKVVVKLHYPFAIVEEYLNVTEITLVGNSSVLCITTSGHSIYYPLKNILRYEIVDINS